MTTAPILGGTSRALLDADELVATARAATGLSDFGETDPMDSLRRLVRSLNEEAALTEPAVAAKRLGMIRVLSNRLLLQNEFNKNPRIGDEQIVKPIVILGLPRSGTTKLQRMIGADPKMQKLPLWKLLYPVKALTPGPGTDVERRIAAAEGFVNAIRTNSPAAYAGHPMIATEPDEEYFAMEISFLAHINTTSFYTPSYERWLDTQSFDNWYVWLKKFMQYQQFVDGAAGRPWVLKAPHHLGYLPLLFKHFPDTTIVHCHRDALTAMTSFCGLIGPARRAQTYNYSAPEVGQYIMRIYVERMTRYLRDRPAFEKTNAFLDVNYRRIVDDAPALIAECYRAAGIALDESSVAAMRTWERANEQHKHGRHQYSLDEYALTEAEITAAFAGYAARFAQHIV